MDQNRISKITWSFVSIILSFLIFSSSVQASSNVYVYDVNGRLTNLYSSSGDVWEYVYDRNGNLLKKRLAEDIIYNGGFESNKNGSNLSDGWSNWIQDGATGSFQVDGTVVSSGTRSQKLSSTSLNGKAIVLMQDIKVKANQPFVYSGRLNAVNLQQAGTQLAIGFYDASGNLTGWHSSPEQTSISVSGFRTRTISGVIPANSVSARVHVYLSGKAPSSSGTVYVDALSFRYNAEANLIANGQFNQRSDGNGIANDWGGWIQDGAAGNYEAVSSFGGYAQKISSNALNGQGVVLLQDLSVEPDKPYVFTGRLNAVSLQNARTLLAVGFYDGAGNLTGWYNSQEQASTTSSGYRTHIISGVTPANSVLARVHVYLIGQTAISSGTVYADSLSFKYDSEASLISNGEFEYHTDDYLGLANGWDGWIQDGTGGVYRVENTAAGWAQKISSTSLGGNSVVLLQDLNVQANRPFVYSGRLNAVALNNASALLAIGFYDAAGNQTGWYNSTELTSTSAGYQTKTISGIIPANTVLARVSVYLMGKSAVSSGTVYADSLSFKYS